VLGPHYTAPVCPYTIHSLRTPWCHGGHHGVGFQACMRAANTSYVLEQMGLSGCRSVLSTRGISSDACIDSFLETVSIVTPHLGRCPLPAPPLLCLQFNVGLEQLVIAPFPQQLQPEDIAVLLTALTVGRSRMRMALLAGSHRWGAAAAAAAAALMPMQRLLLWVDQHIVRRVSTTAVLHDQHHEDLILHSTCLHGHHQVQ
jgi:hypothetical protein